ncbi:MAG: ribonuclease R [Ignavibacteria bacterium]|nr:ribonuclease R [Ignavibacteria bacterium]
MKKSEELRKQIVEILKKASPNHLRLNELAKQLSIAATSKEYSDLKSAIDYLVQNKEIHKSTRRRYSWKPVGFSNEFKGIIRIVQNRGVIETGDADFPIVYCKPAHCDTALDGDTVTVKLLALKKDKRPYGVVTSVVSRNELLIGGKVEHDGDFFFVIPDDDDKYLVDFLVHHRNLNGAKHGDKVIARFLRWDNPHKSPEVVIVEVLGNSGDIAVELDAVLREFSLNASFPPDVENEAKDVAKIPPTRALKDRLDLRKTLVITIDPDDAKDHDDALSLIPLDNGNQLLGVHIADVSYYVREGSALDKEALRRGNSTYLVDRVVPMLPESLSTNICSLVPQEVRLTYSVMMEMTPLGAVASYQIVESMIKSERRCTYNEVQAMIDAPDTTLKGKNAAVQDLALRLNSLAQILRKKRFRQGGIDFETKEIKFILDEHKIPVRAVLKSRTDATSLVEECMLLANKVIAAHIHTVQKEKKIKGNLPFVYRVHDKPDMEKLRDVFRFVGTLGIKTKTQNLNSKEIQAIIKAVENLPERDVINQFLLRSMAKAIYSDSNIGHYGLGFKDYAHFTSPIRRYPDIMVHRLLKYYAANNEYHHAALSELRRWVEVGAEHCSLTERVSVEAERASIKVAQVELAQRHFGEILTGTVSGIVNFGLFVLVDGLGIEGLIPLRDMAGDYYIFDEKNFRLIGKRTHKVFRIGEKVNIRIARINQDKRTIDFHYIDDTNAE